MLELQAVRGAGVVFLNKPRGVEQNECVIAYDHSLIQWAKMRLVALTGTRMEVWRVS